MRIITGTAQGKTYTTEVPDEVIFIYSKHVYFRAQIEGGAGVQIRLIINNEYNSIHHEEMRYADSEGRVTFDIARVLQMLTDSRDKDMSALMYDATDYTPWNMPSWDISMIWNADTMSVQLAQVFTTFVLVNGAHDNAENWRVGYYRTNRAFRLQMWRQYPFTFDIGAGRIDYNLFGNPSTSSPQYPIRKTPVVDAPLGATPQQIRITPEYLIEDRTHSKSTMWVKSQTMLTMNGDTHGSNTSTNTFIYKIEINECPRSDSKTYLRWLGKHGEVFYWLFDNISEDWNVKTDKYQKVINDNTFKGLVTNKMRDNGVIRDTQVTKTRVIATELIDNHYYEIVRSIAESPYVDMLIGEEGDEKWQRINVADGNFSRSLKIAGRVKQLRITLTIEIDEI